MTKARISDRDVKDVLTYTEELVSNYPNRVAGTDACRNVAKRIEEDLSKYCDRSSVKRVPFTMRPASFLKYLPFVPILYTACSVLVFFHYYLPTLILFSLCIFVLYGQFVRCWTLLDPLFPKTTGYNVHGSIEPQGEVKQQVIISAHHDAAYVFHLLDKLPHLYTLFNSGSFSFIGIGFLIALAGTLWSLPEWFYSLSPVLMFIGVPILLPIIFFTTGKVSPGAGDNAIAVAIAVHMAKEFGRTRLNHTRIIVASFDGEEAGARGSRAYCRQNKEELFSTKTYVLNIDTLFKLKDLNFSDRDLNATVKLSRKMAEDCVTIAEDLGYTSVISRMSFGSGFTDAAEFGRIGVEATNIAGISFNIKDYGDGRVYHTSNDTTEHIEPELVSAVIQVIREYALRKDRGVESS